MNKKKANIIAICIGVIASLLVIYQIHNYILINECHKLGASFEYTNGECISNETYGEAFIIFSWKIIPIYIAVGLLVAAITAFISRKILIKKVGKINNAT